MPSGALWAKYNVGAEHGSTPESWYGDYFMWGDVEPVNNKTCTWDNYKYTNGSPGYLIKYCTDKCYCASNKKPDNKLILDIEDDMARANMGGDWKIPIKEQFQELLDNTTSKWVKNYNNVQGLNGMIFTSKINDNELFIPAADYRNLDSVRYIGSIIKMWSSTLKSSTRDSYSTFSAYYLDADHSDSYIHSNYRCLGFPVRGVMIK